MKIKSNNRYKERKNLIMIFFIITGTIGLVITIVYLLLGKKRNTLDHFSLYTAVAIIACSFGIGLSLATFSSICVIDCRGSLLSVEKYFSKSNESQLENYKDKTITCKDIEITEKEDKYIINYKSNDGINKEIWAVKEYVKLYKCKDGDKKIEVYNLPDEIEIKNKMLSFLDFEDYKIYKIYK